MLILVFLTSACKSKKIESENIQKCAVDSVVGDRSVILGRWQLLNKSHIFSNNGPSFIDYSCNQTIFEFKSKDSLIINRSNNFSDYLDGTFRYTYTRSGNLPFGELKINNEIWPATLTESKLVLDNAAMDGGKLTFIRIK